MKYYTAFLVVCVLSFAQPVAAQQHRRAIPERATCLPNLKSTQPLLMTLIPTDPYIPGWRPAIPWHSDFDPGEFYGCAALRCGISAVASFLFLNPAAFAVGCTVSLLTCGAEQVVRR